MKFQDASRFHFDFERQIMEVDLSGLRFETALDMNRHFDANEAAIAASGMDRWYFFINLQGTSIAPAALPTYARRAQALNLHHALGAVRYAASPETERMLAQAARSVTFDFEHIPCPTAARARLEHLRKEPIEPRMTNRNLRFHDLFRRITFDTHNRVLELDLSLLVLEHDRDIVDLFDHVEARIVSMGAPMRWNALVNLTGTEVLPAAWVPFGGRVRTLRSKHIIATARFGASEELAAEMRARAAAWGTEFALHPDRDAALDALRKAALAET